MSELPDLVIAQVGPFVEAKLATKLLFVNGDELTDAFLKALRKHKAAAPTIDSRALRITAAAIDHLAQQSVDGTARGIPPKIEKLLESRIDQIRNGSEEEAVRPEDVIRAIPSIYDLIEIWTREATRQLNFSVIGTSFYAYPESVRKGLPERMSRDRTTHGPRMRTFAYRSAVWVIENDPDALVSDHKKAAGIHAEILADFVALSTEYASPQSMALGEIQIAAEEHAANAGAEFEPGSLT